MYKRMAVLLEGPDDERFFDAVIRPMLEKQYDYVQTWKYAGEKKERTKNYLRSILAMKSDYFFLKDINTSPCITAKKQDVQKDYKKAIDSVNVIIVIREIESWYLAGLDDKSCKSLSLSKLSHTDDITKEQFEKLISEKFVRIDFMIEILKRFSIETSKQK
ncbi:MAG: hypothetical protein NTX52_02310, partial [Planctomycetota bacterium]|nr:hypothetical protein [Planctomycetota bacterium]